MRNVALGEWLNSFLRFNELWNYITFNFVGLQWNNMIAATSFSPFRRRSDPEVSPEVSRTTRYGGNKDAELATVAAQAGRPIERMIASASLTEQFVPLQLRSITLVVVDLLSPYYLDMPQEPCGSSGQGDRAADGDEENGLQQSDDPGQRFYRGRLRRSSASFGRRRRQNGGGPGAGRSADGFGFGVSAMTLRRAFSFWAGLAVAVVFHYALYRIAQPVHRSSTLF